MSRSPCAIGLAVLACAIGCAHRPVPPPVCIDCPDPDDVSRLPAADLQRRLRSLAVAWSKAREDDLTVAQCDDFARHYVRLADAEGETVAAGWFNAAVVRDACGQPQRAAALYRRVLADPDAPVAIRAAAFNNLGIGLVQAGHLAEGEKALRAAIEAEPRSPAPRTNLATVLRRRSADSDEAFVAAEHQLQSALALRSDDRAAFENLARLYYARGRAGDRSYLMLADLVVTQGLRVLERGETTSAALLNVRGLVFVERDDPISAIRAFDAAVAADPTHAQAHLNRAMISLQMRDFDKAHDSLQVALKDPRFADDADAWLAVGVAHRGRRQYERAEKAFVRVHERIHDPRGLYNLGLLYADHIAASQEDFDPAPYRRAIDHFEEFEADAAHHPALSDAVADARRRRGQIRRLLADIDDTRRVEAEVRRLEALERKQHNDERLRLLELERRALEAHTRALAQ